MKRGDMVGIMLLPIIILVFAGVNRGNEQLNLQQRSVVSKCRDVVPYAIKNRCNAKENCPVLARKGYCNQPWKNVKPFKTCSTKGLEKPQRNKKVKDFCKKSCTQCVDGNWSNWGKWSQCSKTCGQGFKVKSRKCNNPPPKGNGLKCQGKSEKIDRCIEKPNCDPCANIDCGIPFGTNRCVDGRCVCGSLSGACPATTPVCFGSGEDATCSCHTGSCTEPNPVCDSDGKCKCNTDTDVLCKAGQSDSCSTNDGKGECKCGTSNECSGDTPKCNTEAFPSPICEACDSSFCSQPLPYCVPTGMPNAGSCQCGGEATCGTTDQTGNTCSSDDANGNCLCGENPVCTGGSVVATCLNNASTPAFEAGDKASSCKCSEKSCTDGTGKVLSNGACSAEKGCTLGACVSCNVNGVPGNGSSQGTCPTGLNCHGDGSCSLCSSTAGGKAGTDADPHSGCTSLNPLCNTDGSECQCATIPLICDSTSSNVCADADTAGICMCGANLACETTSPLCDTTTDPKNPTCTMCKKDDGMMGDAMSQGTCASASLMCLNDGSCQCQIDMNGGGVGDTTTQGTCTEEGRLCLPDGTCKCQKDSSGVGGDGDGLEQGTCKTGEVCNADGSCSACNVEGNPGDNTSQGSCPDAGTICRDNGSCACLTTDDGSGVPGDGSTQGTCTTGMCQAYGTCE